MTSRLPSAPQCQDHARRGRARMRCNVLPCLWREREHFMRALHRTAASWGVDRGKGESASERARSLASK
eukprot:1791757-Rhodomonas_salina.2